MNDILKLKNPERGRNEYFDSLKFYLICVVVLGHTLWEHYNESSVINGIWYWIYTFHMPLFVFLSGFFSNKMEKKKFNNFIIRTFEIYVVFQVLCIIMKYLSDEAITWNLILSPYSIYWYLFSLILWRCILQVTPEKILGYRWAVICVTITAGLIAGFIPISNELSIQRTLSFLPFFVLGYYSRQCEWIENIKCAPIGFVITILVVSSCIYFFMLQRDMFTITVLYENTPYNNAQDILSRFLIWLQALGFGIVIMKVAKPTRMASILGGLTLYIFVYHQFVIEVFEKGLTLLNIPHSLPIIMVEAIVVSTISCVIAGIPLFRYAVNPLYSAIKRK